MCRPIGLGLLLFAFSLTAPAETPFTISPSQGPAGGGTIVTLKMPTGDEGPHVVYFGGVAAVTTIVDHSTVLAVTPPHAPELVEVTALWDHYDIEPEPTGFTFEYTETVTTGPELEYLLLPIFTPPAKGAFGSEFRTRLSATNTGPRSLAIIGLVQDCLVGQPPLVCDPGRPADIEPGGDLTPLLDYSGAPGQFLGVPRADDPFFSASLRVFDVSRSANNFGTEIPIVRYRDFHHEPFALPNVPLDPRFRIALRLYAAEGTQVRVRIGTETHVVSLQGSGQPLVPAYAMFTNFPPDLRSVTVIVEPDGPAAPAVWGFISVTSNDTQHITTITPR